MFRVLFLVALLGISMVAVVRPSMDISKAEWNVTGKPWIGKWSPVNVSDGRSESLTNFRETLEAIMGPNGLHEQAADELWFFKDGDHYHRVLHNTSTGQSTYRPSRNLNLSTESRPVGKDRRFREDGEKLIMSLAYRGGQIQGTHEVIGDELSETFVFGNVTVRMWRKKIV